MLDRRRDFGAVMGDGVGGARWYQDGHYFGGGGNYLFSNPGIAAPPGETLRTMAQAEEAFQRGETELVPKKQAAPPIPTQTLPAKPPQPQDTQQAEGLTREQQLNQMSYFQLDRLVLAAGGPKIQGTGAKAKMIAWLLANTQ